MNLENLTSSNYPFKHWEIFNCLDLKALDEISYSNIPNGNRAYDGTRAADHTGQGIDGKLRLFIDLNNSKTYPYLTKVINELQSKEIYEKIGNLIEITKFIRHKTYSLDPKSLKNTSVLVSTTLS